MEITVLSDLLLERAMRLPKWKPRTGVLLKNYYLTAGVRIFEYFQLPTLANKHGYYLEGPGVGVLSSIGDSDLLALAHIFDSHLSKQGK